MEAILDLLPDDFPTDVDLIAYTPDEVERMVEGNNSFMRVVLEQGVAL
ncbi:MAG: hypothetical protein Kow0069_02980 [Promethearchaeota archaeon]